MSEPKGTVIVTGGTVGLGYHVALSIAQQSTQHHIILASRTNSGNAGETINKAVSRSTASYIPLDLSSMERIRAFVDGFASKKLPPITALLLNAGIQKYAGINYTADGFETTFGVNHVGHALLFYLLRPHLANNCRVLITASGTHDPAQKTMVPDAVYDKAEDLAHPTSDQVRNYDGRQKYATSKLCNIMWMYALQRRLADSNTHPKGPKWTVAAFDPGLMPGTGLTRDAPAVQRFVWIHVLPRLLPLLRFLVSPNIHTPRESGGALAELAIGDSMRDVMDGKYFEGTKAIGSSVANYDKAKQNNLWDWTVNAVARNAEEKQGCNAVYLSKA